MKAHIVVGVNQVQLRNWMETFVKSRPPKTCLILWHNMRVQHPVGAPTEEWILFDAQPNDLRVKGLRAVDVRFLDGVQDELRCQYQERIWS